MNNAWLSKNKSKDNRSDETEKERIANIVSSVIHEYDVIDDPPCASKMAQNDQQEKVLTNDQSKLSQSSNERIIMSYPRINCKEKIVICVDLSSEMDKVTFRSRAGDKWTPLKLVKRALGFFLHSKSRINKLHEYSLVVLHNSAKWVRDFTSNPKEILSFFEDEILLDTIACETFDASALFDVLLKRLDLPAVEGDVSVTPPPYIVRVLMIYGRSHCPIEFRNKESFKQLDSSPYFFVDVMYIHEAPSEENKCEMIFDSLCDFDEKGMSYIFEAARNPTKFYDQMSQLLAHPLQRPLQKDIACRLHNVAELVEQSSSSSS
ncbi:BRISC and BRCA1-A complex member 1-like [Mytilus trossulus]|uniref:BRISC and BRCA1-A complex member 1-like n=1 Tax=Mytilus trossulus TaxID=6551 RepID=UPI00300465C5